MIPGKMPSASLMTSFSQSFFFLAVLAVVGFGTVQVVACEVGCVCDEVLQSVVCSGLNLTTVPKDLPLDTRFLNLTDNGIVEINSTDFDYITELKRLDLSHNGLSKLSTDAFARSLRLRTLLLDHNNLTGDEILPVSKIPVEELFLAANQIDNLDNFSEFSSLSVLDLSGNAVRQLPAKFFESLPNLRHLLFSRNRLESFEVDVTSGDNQLRFLNLSHNSIARFTMYGLFEKLEVLDLSWNRFSVLDPEWFVGLPRLTAFVFSGNPVELLPDFAFRYLPNLLTIELNFLQNVISVGRNSFGGVYNIVHLRLAHNARLREIDSLAFDNLTQLRHLDLSDNNLSSFDAALVSAPKRLEVVNLSGNPWRCDCDFLDQLLLVKNVFCNSGCRLLTGSACGGLLDAASLADVDDLNSNPVDCQTPRIVSSTKVVLHKVGASALLDCVAVGNPRPQIIWITNRNLTIESRDPVPLKRVTSVETNAYVHQFEEESRMLVLPNGSLHILYVTRKEAGDYRCLAFSEFGNASMLIQFQLNYEAMAFVTIKSIILGFLTATCFFLIAAVIGVARYLAFVCSKKERKKRKSIREVLEAIQDYKAAQFDRFSAYRTAKMDQLSAFKSAKIDQLSAFRHARIGKLRTYKQSTVTSVLHYLERMREHYTNQTARIKENCAQQMDRLRENYGIQRGKFKDYRSQQVEKVRENYNAQVLKIREYGVQQMTRLREQYKSQQQNVLKLLELLDIGNCVTVIEAECMHTESIIFDASIAFDFEAHPIHVPRDTDSNLSDESHYLTASESGSGSLSNVPHSVSCTVDVEPRMKHFEAAGNFPYVDSLEDSGSDVFLESLHSDAFDLSEITDITDKSSETESSKKRDC